MLVGQESIALYIMITVVVALSELKLLHLTMNTIIIIKIFIAAVKKTKKWINCMQIMPVIIQGIHMLIVIVVIEKLR